MDISKKQLSVLAPTRTDCKSTEAKSKFTINHTRLGNSSLDTNNPDLGIPDTPTLAKLDRENQGLWEAEYSYGGEADLHQHYNSCGKNPGHKNFIPVAKFSIEDLPEGCRDPDFVDYIRAESDLTVRVAVRYVSDRRPETFPDSEKPYPGYGNRGQNRMTVGTGWVDGVVVYRDCPRQSCKCKDCRYSSTPETKFAMININTAKHVVFDDLEAKHTTCHLFFDSGGTPDTCSGVVTITGMESLYSSIETDQHHMMHFTHDPDLGDRLRKTCKDKLNIKLYKILPQITHYNANLCVADKQPLSFIVSHPHGCRKHISIGHWTSVSAAGTRVFTYEYTTATCPGSSGAKVVMPHQCSPESLHLDMGFLPGTHRGKSEERPGVNYFKSLYVSLSERYLSISLIPDPSKLEPYASTPLITGYQWAQRDMGPGRLYPILEDLDIPDTQTLAIEDRENQGSWEAEFSYGGEADLHQHYDNCAKNPGHQNFIPVDKFNIEDLPEGYRDPDIVDYIRAESDLTVRVTVRYVSHCRPATVPGSDKPYPGYANRGQKIMTVGTGWVHHVYTCRNHWRLKCGCNVCRNSSTPEITFDVIIISSANHVVFDNIEAEHTTCHLFFDSGGTPGTCSGVVTLKGMSCEHRDMASDCCHLKHFTHDLDLAKRLKQAWARRYNLMTIIASKLPQISYYRRKPIALDKQPLLFIVSHPHGCRKHISIGHWTSVTKSTVSSYQYTKPTCPGSSGAHIYMPNEFSPLSIHAGNHCGASDERPGINYYNVVRDNQMTRSDFVSVEVWPMFGGPWKDNYSCVDEEDPHKHIDTCQKNPGLLNFCPVDKFSMEYLPPFYRKHETMEAIKSVSDLTVQVSVRCVSEERPKTVTGTDIPYPWYNAKGGSQMRVGSAWISHVICLKHCFPRLLCRECGSLLPRKTDGAYVYVSSAAPLVYNRMEAEHTTCHLFFDSGETPDLCKDVVTLTDMAHYCNNVINDKCTMVYAIKDHTFAKSLKDMTKRYEQCLVSLKKLLDRTDSGVETDEGNSNPEIPAYIVVSHPHGSAKQTNVSYVGNNDNVGTNENQSHNASIICPGSVGAPVIVLGWETLYPCCD